MKKNDIIMYAAIAVGGYALYWYLTNYGPTGAVAVSGGTGSYWASWFGSTTTPTVIAAAGTTPTSTSTGALTNTTAPTTTTTTTTTPVTTGPVTTQQMATQQQLQAINSLLSPSDQRTFSNMALTLTYQQAASMLANAQACSSGQVFNPTTQLCDTPLSTPITTTQAGGSTPGQTRGGLRGMSGSPGGGEGMGMIMPTPATITQANSGVGLGRLGDLGDLGALPKKSPWGRLPVNQKYLN